MIQWLNNIYPGDTVASFLIRVLAEITLMTLVSIIATRMVGERNPAIRHGICICALVGVAAAPLSTLLLEHLGWQTFQISLEHERTQVISSSQATLLEPVASTAFATPFWTLERSRTAASGLLLLWVSGTGYLLLRLWSGTRKVQKLRIHTSPVNDARLDRILTELATRQQMPRTSIHLSKRLHSPVVIGAWKTTVLFPERLLDRLDDEQLQSVLAHELTHVKQRDPLIGLIQRLVEATYWPHPLVHVLNRDLVRAREEVCDNVALHGTTPPQYADTLLTVALGGNPHPSIPGALGLMTRPWRLEERISGLLDPQRRLQTTMNMRHLALMGIAFATGTAIIAGTRVVAAPYPPHPEDTLDLYTHVNPATHEISISQHLKKHPKSTGSKPVQIKTHYRVQTKNGSPVHGVPMKSIRVMADPNAKSGTTYTVQSDDSGPAKVVVVTKALPAGAAAAAPPAVSAPARSSEDVTVSTSVSAPARISEDVTVSVSGAQPGKPVTVTSVPSSQSVAVSAAPVVVSKSAAKGSDSHAMTYTVVAGAPIAEPHRQTKTVIVKDGVVTITSNEPDMPVRVQTIKANKADTIVLGVTSSDNSHTLTIPETEPIFLKAGNGKMPVQVIKAKHLRSDDGVIYVTSTDQHEAKVIIGSQPNKQLRVQDRKVVTKQGKNGTLYLRVEDDSQAKSSPKPKETIVYIDGGHVKVVGDNIKVVHVDHKWATKKSQTSPPKKH